MNETIIQTILSTMQSSLNPEQLSLLDDTLRGLMQPICVSGKTDLLESFLEAKKVEGCSKKTIDYYESTLTRMFDEIALPPTAIATDDLRKYLAAYEAERGSSKTTIDNIRRIIASFYAWLEDEGYIVKSPARRIHHVKQPKRVKGTFTDEELEAMREGCENARDLAIVDLLASTGMRVGELVALNRNDVDLTERECLVTGKGDKQRIVYFDARAKLHLQSYLEERNDGCPALFTTLNGTANRVSIGAVELRLRQLGEKTGVPRVHPHKFRRTLATNAIDKGMPIEQVQKLLGHEKIDTTMHYALVSQSNVKASHRKYLE